MKGFKGLAGATLLAWSALVHANIVEAVFEIPVTVQTIYGQVYTHTIQVTNWRATYGKTTKVPTLWLYSENDQFMGNVFPRQWYDAFVNAGGEGTFVRLPAFGAAGHSSFTRNRAAWTAAFEAFLKKAGF